jgi:RNA polymerase-interacting CarD/CdnL/TRCF family regulator
MTTDAKINAIAAILRDLIRSMESAELPAVKRYNMLYDLDRILDEGGFGEMIEDDSIYEIT